MFYICIFESTTANLLLNKSCLDFVLKYSEVNYLLNDTIKMIFGHLDESVNKSGICKNVERIIKLFINFIQNRLKYDSVDLFNNLKSKKCMKFCFLFLSENEFIKTLTPDELSKLAFPFDSNFFIIWNKLKPYIDFSLFDIFNKISNLRLKLIAEVVLENIKYDGTSNSLSTALLSIKEITNLKKKIEIKLPVDKKLEEFKNNLIIQIQNKDSDAKNNNNIFSNLIASKYLIEDKLTNQDKNFIKEFLKNLIETQSNFLNKCDYDYSLFKDLIPDNEKGNNFYNISRVTLAEPNSNKKVELNKSPPNQILNSVANYIKFNSIVYQFGVSKLICDSEKETNRSFNYIKNRLKNFRRQYRPSINKSYLNPRFFENLGIEKIESQFTLLKINKGKKKINNELYSDIKHLVEPRTKKILLKNLLSNIKGDGPDKSRFYINHGFVDSNRKNILLFFKVNRDYMYKVYHLIRRKVFYPDSQILARLEDSKYTITDKYLVLMGFGLEFYQFDQINKIFKFCFKIMNIFEKIESITVKLKINIGC